MDAYDPGPTQNGIYEKQVREAQVAPHITMVQLKVKNEEQCLHL